MKPQNATQLHEEHAEWMGEITFMHNELLYFDNVLLRMLEEVQDKKEVNKIEEFKSQFDNQQDKLNSMRERIAGHEKSLNFDFSADGDTQHLGHEEMRFEVMEFRKQFNRLKNDFYTFVDEGKHW